MIIVFQDEIRKALTQVGRNPFFQSTNSIEEVAIIEELCQAAHILAKQRVGALIVLERETGLKNYIEAGTAMSTGFMSGNQRVTAARSAFTARKVMAMVERMAMA